RCSSRSHHAAGRRPRTNGKGSTTAVVRVVASSLTHRSDEQDAHQTALPVEWRLGVTWALRVPAACAPRCFLCSSSRHLGTPASPVVSGLAGRLTTGATFDHSG